MCAIVCSNVKWSAIEVAWNAILISNNLNKAHARAYNITNFNRNGIFCAELGCSRRSDTMRGIRVHIVEHTIKLATDKKSSNFQLHQRNEEFRHVRRINVNAQNADDYIKM